MATKGFAERLKNLLRIRSDIDDSFFDDLSDTLVEGDLGAAEAFKVVEELQNHCRKNGIKDGELIKEALAGLLEKDLQLAKPIEEAMPKDRLGIILLLGVNGVGKTTSAAKLASRYLAFGRKPLLAAADTFRAAAIDQLKIHGQRLSIRVVAHKQGGDPAAVVYDAIEAATSAGNTLIIADTAGRMHTKSGLVEELKKIDRIVESKAAGADYRKYLVVDATTGRNAFAQASIFHEAVKLDAAILTKYDSTARGGIAFALARQLKLPTAYVCMGERYEDIRLFDSKLYAREFVGLA
ncbi:signal recognition particle-docking protein FtsY [Treponema sp.]